MNEVSVQLKLLDNDNPIPWFERDALFLETLLLRIDFGDDLRRN
jgi:hypothetical protein